MGQENMHSSLKDFGGNRVIGGRKSRFKIEVSVYICVCMPVRLRRANTSTFIF